MDKANRKAIIAGNWKMNKTATEAAALIDELIPAVKDANCEVVICTPFTSLVTAVEKTRGTNIHVGAENVHFEKSGAFTGEISADMLVDLGVEYVITGHSERRQYFAETDETVNKRTRAALAAGLKVIVCVGENLTDGILSTLFWAAAGLLLAGLPGAAALAACHRAANVLDAMWGKLNETYRCFGTAAARLDDVLNWCPARLALPCIVLAAALLPGLDARACRRVGWRDRHAHESPNSAWSEAAFAGALGLRLGGPAWYGPLYRDHPWLGDGTPLATARHIRQAVRLMWGSLLVFATLASLLPAAVACI